MTEREKKIQELCYNLSMLYFCEYVDFSKARELEKQIDELDHGRKGWVAETYITDPNFSHTKSYISINGMMGDGPTYFETEEEAREAAEALGLEKSHWHTEFKWMEGRE